MTRRDFVLIAQTIRQLPSFDARDGGQNVSDVVRFDALVSRFADSLRETNPRFDRDRFVAACNGKEQR
jgi:hypothetical protein